jgi:predicted Co/Zn/Cd cation transporter (cation efflux family)
MKSLTVIKSPVVTLRLAVMDLLLIAPMDTTRADIFRTSVSEDVSDIAVQ